MMERQAHWQDVYTTKSADAVSWYQPSPEPSLRMIEDAGVAPPARIIDVGGGASGLVDALLDRGFQVTVLDIAEAALEVSKARLGEPGMSVNWQAADITRWRPDGQYDLWHDRAVFHFLTDDEDRRRYLEALEAGLKLGGWAVIATFAEDGPEKCSGLDVRRYSATDLERVLGIDFKLVSARRETHTTPWGSEQRFTWTLFQRIA